ncbi:MAG: hypothetical protein K6G65_06700 [Lachnospiraceae bacterium]|nr:hypothetical protein [Lachnospiraceae bacterium]
MSDSKKSLFRKKTMERIKNPEQLDKYLRVPSPGVWVLLLAVLIFFVGLVVWSVMGHLETTVDAEVVVFNKKAVVTQIKQSEYVKKTDMSTVGKGTIVLIEGKEYVANKTEVNEEGLTVLYADTDLPNGMYSAQIIVERINAIQFLLG